MKSNENYSYSNLCQSCEHQSCCTGFTTPFLFSQDIEKLIKIKHSGASFLVDVEIKGKKHKTIRKKENSNNCYFWDEEKKICSIYEERPFDCKIFPFDIYLIDGNYHWIVYSCNPKSDWQWCEDHLKSLENEPQFEELLLHASSYCDLSKIKQLDETEQIPHTVLRKVNLKK